MFFCVIDVCFKTLKKPDTIAICDDIKLFENGARVLIGFNEKRSKIKGFRQSINGINLKIKYFSFQNTL